MTAEKYVNEIVKKVACSREKKNDIKKQLLADIRERARAGESEESIFAQMGSVKEIADSFNDTLTDAEKMAHKRRKIMCIAGVVLIVVIALVSALYWLLPKGKSIDDSRIFTKVEVEQRLMQIVDDFDAGNYEAMRAYAIPQMQKVLEDQEMDAIKDQLGEEWGQQSQVGAIYMQELVQAGRHYAVCQVNVSYENINVTYTITLDRELKLAGLYMK